MADQKIKVLLAKPGLDGHDRGAKVLAQGLRDAGMEVVYLGLRQTPEQISAAAIQEDADVVGLSSLSGAHVTLFPRVVELVKKQSDKKMLFIGGGIIPSGDVQALKEAGFGQIFGPGSAIADIAGYIKGAVNN
ncbi:cobalamin B12-binding domain-containing protein [Chloroflexota bacterium]